jgi:hypothetical protein
MLNSFMIGSQTQTQTQTQFIFSPTSALRAMGCSLMGVSKVFLRHVAPTRYGDQTFAPGEHLAPGFSQWRLALAS